MSPFLCVQYQYIIACLFQANTYAIGKQVTPCYGTKIGRWKTIFPADWPRCSRTCWSPRGPKSPREVSHQAPRWELPLRLQKKGIPQPDGHFNREHDDKPCLLWTLLSGKPKLVLESCKEYPWLPWPSCSCGPWHAPWQRLLKTPFGTVGKTQAPHSKSSTTLQLCHVP